MKKSVLSTLLVSTLGVTNLAIAHEAGDFIIRGGAANVSPANDQFTVFAASQTVNLGAGAINVAVEDDTQLGLNLVYMIDSNWAVEVLAATPFSHDITVHTGAGATKLGETKHLPPTLSAVYFFDSNSTLKPYLGVGVNYTFFFDEKFNTNMQGSDSPVIESISDGTSVTPIDAPLNAGNLKLSNSLGLSFQAGIDYKLNESWLLNASARYIDIQTDASFTAVDGSVPGKVTVDIDPMVYMVSVGYQF